MDNSRLSFILSFIHSFTQVEIPVMSLRQVADVHGDEQLEKRPRQCDAWRVTEREGWQMEVI